MFPDRRPLRRRGRHAADVPGAGSRNRPFPRRPWLGDHAQGPEIGAVADDDFHIGKIDEVIHGRVRLGIMAYLMAGGPADFSTLKAKLETTDGTLSVHLRKLEDAGFIAIEKSFRDRKPRTEARMTALGEKAFRAYLDAIGKLAGLA